MYPKSLPRSGSEKKTQIFDLTTVLPRRTDAPEVRYDLKESDTEAHELECILRGES